MRLDTDRCGKITIRDAKAAELLKEPHDLMWIVDSIIHKSREIHPALKINMQIGNKCDTLLTINRERITQVIQSLIDNAISCSNGEGILVSLTSTHAADRYNGDELIGAIKISVFCDRTSLSEKVITSTRLCLTMHEEIISLHGGEIWAQTNQDTGGLVVGFTLLYDEMYNKDDEQEEAARQEEHAKSLNILFVDDDKNCLTAAAMLLTDLGHNVTTASTGREALSKLEEGYRDFDLVLLDIIMPDLNGLETLCFVREHPEYSDIPIVMQSGMTDGLGLQQAIRLGARLDLLRKPFTREDLIRFLNGASKYCKRYKYPDFETINP